MQGAPVDDLFTQSVGRKSAAHSAADPPPSGLWRNTLHSSALQRLSLGRVHLPRGLVLAFVLLAGGCSSIGIGGSSGKCPKPIVYDDASLKEVQAALRALPRDSILHQMMADYENERDDLRFCK